MTDIAELWQEHRTASFPADCRGKEVDGVDLVLLDSLTAGCISSFLASSGQLDSERRETLSECGRELDLVMSQLEGEAAQYFGRLRDLVKAVLEALR
jgi:hypothetical protein